MRLIDADKLFEQVENLYKSAQTPERQVYSKILDMISESSEIKNLYVVLVEQPLKDTEGREGFVISDVGGIFTDIDKAYESINENRKNHHNYSYTIVERKLDIEPNGMGFRKF